MKCLYLVFCPECVPAYSNLQSKGTWVEFVSYCCVKNYIILDYVEMANSSFLGQLYLLLVYPDLLLWEFDVETPTKTLI